MLVSLAAFGTEVEASATFGARLGGSTYSISSSSWLQPALATIRASVTAVEVFGVGHAWRVYVVVGRGTLKGRVLFSAGEAGRFCATVAVVSSFPDHKTLSAKLQEKNILTKRFKPPAFRLFFTQSG